MSTRILVLADTHMPRKNRELPWKLLQEARKANLIVHLGDFTGESVADALCDFGELVAVHGNNDSSDIRRRYPARVTMDVEGRRIALIHGHEGGRTAHAAAAAIRDADIVLFGHSHMPRIYREEARLLFNPGSPTERRFAPYRSFGILEIGTSVEATLVQLP